MTQHKTLQARLSEEILHGGKQSRFIRTDPGRFFLRAFLQDTSVPREYRSEMKARRRKRDLIRGASLVVSRSAFESILSHKEWVSAQHALALMKEKNWYNYADRPCCARGLRGFT